MHVLTPGVSEIRSSALLRGQSVKRANALTAVLSGALPGVLVGVYLQPKISRLLLGLAIGLLWANGFEYLYHRYFCIGLQARWEKDTYCIMQRWAGQKSRST